MRKEVGWGFNLFSHLDPPDPVEHLAAGGALDPQQVRVLGLLALPGGVVQLLDGGVVVQTGGALALKLVVTPERLPPCVRVLVVIHLAVTLGYLLTSGDVPVGHRDKALAHVDPHEARVTRVVEQRAGQIDSSAEGFDLGGVDPLPDLAGLEDSNVVNILRQRVGKMQEKLTKK